MRQVTQSNASRQAAGNWNTPAMIFKDSQSGAIDIEQQFAEFWEEFSENMRGPTIAVPTIKTSRHRRIAVITACLVLGFADALWNLDGRIYRFSEPK